MHISFGRFVFVPLLLALGSCSGQEAEQQPPQYRIQSGQDLEILTTTDPHYLSPSLTDFGPAFNQFLAAGDGKQLGYSADMIGALGNDIAIRKPDAVIISGDLSNNGEKRSHRDLARHLKTIEQDTGTRVYVIPGNHDILNPWARKFKGKRQYETDNVTPKEFRSIYNAFGYNEALLQDNASLSYLAAPSDELWLLMLDTSQYAGNKALGHPQLEGRVTPGTLQWIDECGNLAASSGAQIVAVMHHSLLVHNDFIQEGFTVDGNAELIEALRRNGIKAALSGHIHIQDISENREGGGSIYDIADSALSVYPHQYGMLQYSSANHTLDYSTFKLNMELWARASGSTDDNLLHFDAYSEQNFRKRSAARSYARLAGDAAYARYSEAELQAMADAAGRLNEIYFAGTARSDIPEVTSSAGFRLWQGAPPSGLRSYVLGMARLMPKDNHRLHIELPEAEKPGPNAAAVHELPGGKFGEMSTQIQPEKAEPRS
ncbi:metallophosphoesterase [Paenibacillus sp. S150]|uniref:metallophosphoesterase n=1 Tax=Paenibacillus sp. S150 TaxID=2749826 RepID=UPI001C5A2E12|nr:metallophosphoesterase [Paenibacillus sp. S150]MBW4081896.1 metallophosphoesterase [Paenibacillus sp. S150]